MLNDAGAGEGTCRAFRHKHTKCSVRGSCALVARIRTRIFYTKLHRCRASPNGMHCRTETQNANTCRRRRHVRSVELSRFSHTRDRPAQLRETLANTACVQIEWRSLCVHYCYVNRNRRWMQQRMCVVIIMYVVMLCVVCVCVKCPKRLHTWPKSHVLLGHSPYARPHIHTRRH